MRFVVFLIMGAIIAFIIGATVASISGCAFLGFGPNAGPQPVAPQTDLVPEWSGTGAPLFKAIPDSGTQ
jgi:hypothetical protein